MRRYAGAEPPISVHIPGNLTVDCRVAVLRGPRAELGRLMKSCSCRHRATEKVRYPLLFEAERRVCPVPYLPTQPPCYLVRKRLL
jgi:hypothetical protein